LEEVLFLYSVAKECKLKTPILVGRLHTTTLPKVNKFVPCPHPFVETWIQKDLVDEVMGNIFVHVGRKNHRSWTPKGNFIFQPSIFSGAMFVSGRPK